ncbi:MAG: C40 family peptidase [Actinobacteria bacterium]|nr:C40 family peptidase [Actinomycetota bacterium]
MANPAIPDPLAAIKRAAAANGLDWRPLAAIAQHESGLNPAAIGDGGHAFGLFQNNNAGGTITGDPNPRRFLNPNVSADYTAKALARLNLSGLTPEQQIHEIVYRYERPADKPAEERAALGYYRTRYAGLPGQVAPAGQPLPATPQASAPVAGAPQPTTQGLPNLAAYQQSYNLRQQGNQRALDALGKISGQRTLAPQAPDFSSLTASSMATQQTQPVTPTQPTLPRTHVTVPLKGAPPKGLTAEGQKAVELAKHYLGTKYVFGAADPKSGFDCSGLLQYVWGKLGVKIPRVAADQFKAGRAVDPSQLQPGDALAFSEGGRIGHIGMYIGNGQFIQAPHTGDVVKISPLAGHYQSILAGARRFA